jgi:DNA repair protein RadC
MARKRRRYRILRLKVPCLKGQEATNEVKNTDDAEAVIRAFSLKENLPRDREVFGLLGLNRKLGLIGAHLISIGTENEVLMNVKDVFRPALEMGAAGIIVWHTHPSGTLCRNKADLKTTKLLQAAGDVIELPVIDALVLTKKGCISLTEEPKKKQGVKKTGRKKR